MPPAAKITPTDEIRDQNYIISDNNYEIDLNHYAYKYAQNISLAIQTYRQMN